MPLLSTVFWANIFFATEKISMNYILHKVEHIQIWISSLKVGKHINKNQGNCEFTKIHPMLSESLNPFPILRDNVKKINKSLNSK